MEDNSFLKIWTKILTAIGLNSHMIMKDQIEIHIKYKVLLTNDNKATLIIIAISAVRDRAHSLSIKNNNINQGVALEVSRQCEVGTKETTACHNDVVLNFKMKSSIEDDRH